MTRVKEHQKWVQIHMVDKTVTLTTYAIIQRWDLTTSAISGQVPREASAKLGCFYLLEDLLF